MTNDEKRLLENVLDALDRLFDRESSIIDVHALIFATSKALPNADYFAVLDNAVDRLEIIIRSGLDTEGQRDAALTATNDLRIFLAESLDF